MAFTSCRTIFLIVACSIFILFENIVLGFIEKKIIYLHSLLSVGKIGILGWMEGLLVERFEKLFYDKGFLCIFASSQVDCLWVLAKKNNPFGAAFNSTRFKMFSEELSFL